MSTGKILDVSQFGAIEQIPELHDPANLRQIARAFTVLFQLANTAEQKEIVRVNRSREHRRESILDAVGQLKARGCSPDEIRELLAGCLTGINVVR